MGAIVVACVEPREPAAEEDWVEAEAITESLKKKKNKQL
jgi:phosphosulfolactate phosphohydrolase-like enzyme